MLLKMHGSRLIYTVEYNGKILGVITWHGNTKLEFYSMVNELDDNDNYIDFYIMNYNKALERAMRFSDHLIDAYKYTLQRKSLKISNGGKDGFQ